MEYVLLGNTGVQVSTLAFGTMSFGGDADEAMSGQMYHRCRDAGINIFDCANVYQKGTAEEILGRLVADHRHEVLVTSKAYFPMGEDVNARGASRLHLRHAVESSLRRLGTEYIDIYFIHRFDGATALDETLRALDDLVRSGKVLYLGASNFAAWQVARALGVSALHDLEAFACIQPMYNLVKRQAEVEILPQAADAHLGVFPYSPLGGGLLTGKYGSDRRPDAGRIVDMAMYSERYGDRRHFEAAARFTEFAAVNGYDPVALAVAWVASHPAVTAPIIGARNLVQLEGSLAADDLAMTPDLRVQISALSAAPPPATDRNEEGTDAGGWTR